METQRLKVYLYSLGDKLPSGSEGNTSEPKLRRGCTSAWNWKPSWVWLEFISHQLKKKKKKSESG